MNAETYKKIEHISDQIEALIDRLGAIQRLDLDDDDDFAEAIQSLEAGRTDLMDWVSEHA